MSLVISLTEFNDSWKRGTLPLSYYKLGTTPELSLDDIYLLLPHAKGRIDEEKKLRSFRRKFSKYCATLYAKIKRGGNSESAHLESEFMAAIILEVNESTNRAKWTSK